MRDHALPQADFHHPATFRSLGAASPFTTTPLSGARIRKSRDAGIEIVIPNPSGGRGLCIFQWRGVQAICQPTLHDSVLFRQLSLLATIDPARVRETAWKVAIDGYAGREAMAAGETALANDRAERLLAHFRLMVRLLERVEPRGPEPMGLAGWRPELDRRATAALHKLAPVLGRPAAQLRNDITAMGNAFGPLGVAREDRNARIPRTISRLLETGAAISGWLEADPAHEFGGVGRAVAEAMRLAARRGEALLDDMHKALSDPKGLLVCWIKNPDDILALASRCDWLLDGWERIGLLWCTANSNASRRAMLLEMAPLVPVLPSEVLAWNGVCIPPTALDGACRVTSREDSWRNGGAAFGLVERNERLRAMSV